MISLLHLPLIPQRFYAEQESSPIKAVLAKIRQQFGTIINSVALMTNLPERLITSFIFIESAGNPNAVNRGSGATGLMQLVPVSASAMIGLEFRLGRLGEAEKAVLRRYLGNRLDCITSMKHFSQKLPCNQHIGNSITRTDLLIPELNILVGAIYLGILIDQFTERGVVRLDKVVIKYNQGYFRKIMGTTPAQVYASAPSETRNYFKKLAGINNVVQLSA